MIGEISRELQRKLKFNFRFFFEGISVGGVEEIPPIIDIPILNLGICAINFSKNKNDITMEVVLERPGLLIGRAGTTINRLNEFLNEFINNDDDFKDFNINVTIKESKLWSNYG